MLSCLALDAVNNAECKEPAVLCQKIQELERPSLEIDMLNTERTQKVGGVSLIWS